VPMRMTDKRYSALSKSVERGGISSALRELFELDQHAVDAVAQPELPLVARADEIPPLSTDFDRAE
jgi:glutamyl-tRNA reductase